MQKFSDDQLHAEHDWHLQRAMIRMCKQQSTSWESERPGSHQLFNHVGLQFFRLPLAPRSFDTRTSTWTNQTYTFLVQHRQQELLCALIFCMISPTHCNRPFDVHFHLQVLVGTQYLKSSHRGCSIGTLTMMIISFLFQLNSSIWSVAFEKT